MRKGDGRPARRDASAREHGSLQASARIGTVEPVEESTLNTNDDGFPIGIGRLLLRSVVPAALAAVVGAALVFALSTRMDPTYQATAVVLASSTDQSLARFDVALASPPTIDLAAYASVALSRTIFEGARALLDDPGLLDEVRVNVRSEIMNVSSLLRIDVRGEDPVAAATVANAMARALLEWDQQRSRDNLERIMLALEEQISALTEQILILQVTPGVAADQLEGQVRLRAERQQQLASVRALGASVVGMLDIVEPAVAPGAPLIPQPTLYAVIAFLALFLIVTGSLMLAYLLDNRPRTSADVSRIIGLPVLAEFGPLKRGTAVDGRALGYLRANLDPELAGTEPVVVLVTSATPVAGKGRLAHDLAASFVDDEHATLFVDADFVEPSLMDLYDLDEASGPLLEEHLGDGAPEAFGVALQTSDGLALLPNVGADAATASHLLRRGWQRAVERWKQAREVIVVDTPPLLSTPDALALMPTVTGVLLVVDLRTVTRAQLMQAFALTRRSRGTLFGLVVTGCQTSTQRQLPSVERVQGAGLRPKPRSSRRGRRQVVETA